MRDDDEAGTEGLVAVREAWQHRAAWASGNLGGMAEAEAEDTGVMGRGGQSSEFEVRSSRQRHFPENKSSGPAPSSPNSDRLPSRGWTVHPNWSIPRSQSG